METRFQLSNYYEFREEMRSLETQYFIEEMRSRGQDMTRVVAAVLKNQMSSRKD